MRSRPLAILISVLVLISTLFVVTSSASGTENLIESDLTQWESIDYDSVSSVKKGDLYRLSSTSASADYYMGIVYDLPSFVVGHSYTLKFRLPSASEVSSAWNISYTDDNFLAHYKNSTVTVGYGFLNSAGIAITNEVVLFEFNSSNVSKYFGKDLSTSFVAGSSAGRPCVFIAISNDDGNVHHFFFSDFVLYDNDDNSGQIKGILGILHSLRWDIFGGVCDSEDCAHSSDFNPHTSLTERLTTGFSNLFNFIASKFEEGSTLNTWFNGLSDGVTNLCSNVNTWLSGLGDKINTKLGDVITKITGGLTDLGIDIGGFVDGAVSVIDGLFQKFFDWIETFKPRVYERFKWQRGIINYQTGEVGLRDENYPYVIVSDFFTVEPGTKVYLHYEHISELGALCVFQYDYYGNYQGVLITFTSSFEKFELPAGYLYRFRAEYPPGETDLGHINQYVRVYTDEGWIMSFIHSIEDFGTGCLNMVLYFDWYGDYENPFTFSLPFIDFIADTLENFTSFFVDANNRIIDLKSKIDGPFSVVSLILEKIPILTLIGITSLVFVCISRLFGI